MSHTMNVKTEIRDLDALKTACERLGIRTEKGTFRLYSTQETGTAVYLPGWRFPAVIKDNGEISIDNYGERWGKTEELNRLTAYYGLEKAKAEAYKQGYSVTEGYDTETEELTLTVNVGGY